MTHPKAQIRFIFATIFLDVLGIGFIIPILPDVIRRFGHSESFVNEYYGYFVSVYALMQLLMSPLLGVLSDRFGRRPILLVSLMGASLDYVMMAYAPTLTLLFIGRMISGLTGASMTVATSYIADVSDDTNRAANFGMIGAAFGLGFIFGPIMGGFLGTYDLHYPFLAAAFLNLLNFAFGYFVLPESLPPSLRRAISLKRLNPLKALVHAFSHPGILMLICVHFFFQLSGLVYPSIWTLFVQHKFSWSSFDVGLSLSVVGLATAAVQGGLTRIIIPKLGESRSIVVGLIIQMIAMVLFAFVAPPIWLYPVILFSSLSGISGPALQSILTKFVPANEQGELQGSLISITSLASILAPLLYTQTLDFGIQHLSFPGLPFISSMVLCLVCFVILIVWKNKPTNR